MYKDPATGAESLYVRDPETGEWYNPSTNSIMNPDDLERFNKQRMEDQKWTRDQTDKLRNRTAQTDRLLQDDQEKLKQKYDEIDRQGEKDKAAIRSGTYGMSDEQRKKYLNKRQENYVTKQTAAHRTADNWDTATKTLEVTEKIADITVDGLSIVTAPVGGQLVADVYTGVKNVGKSTMDAAVNGKSIVDGFTKGLANAGADIAQNHAGGKWYAKLATYVGTETGKELIIATIDGEDKVEAAKKALINGTFKYGVSEIGDTISGGVGQQNSNAMKQHYKEINRVWNKDLSQKSVNKLTSMNYQKYFGKETTRELVQGFGQSITKEVGNTAYDVGAGGKSVTESMFDDKW